MKKLNLFVFPMLFSSLLIGCGMKGPLYKAPQPTEKQQNTQKTEINEQDKNDAS